MENLKNDINQFYKLKIEYDRINEQIKQLKKKILLTMKLDKINYKFEFSDCMIYMAENQNNNISQELIREVIREKYKNIDDKQFILFLKEKIKKRPKNSYLKVDYINHNNHNDIQDNLDNLDN